ncbi:MAG: hypothetical protein D6820_10155 [Lentisphaerae bacterium]|nr:MAG: hypothetical protein D6820_10155 [Lentisphaerota bacterium]
MKRQNDSIWSMAVFCLLVGSSLLCSSMLNGCGLISSRERSLKNTLDRYRYLLAHGNWAQAQKFYYPKFKWIRYDGTVLTGKKAIDAWHKELQKYGAQDVEFINVEVAKLKDNVYLVTMRISIFYSDSMQIATYKWQVSMRWGWVKGKWVLGELKELSERVKSRS